MLRPRLRWYEWSTLTVVVFVRVVAALSFAQTPYAVHPLVDAYTYWEQAQQLAAGGSPFAAGLYQPPGYPYFLYLVGMLTGRPELPVVRAVQGLLGVGTSAGLMALGRAVGKPMGAPWAGAVAALLYTLYPTTLLFELDILTPALSGAAFVGALCCSALGRSALLAIVGGLLLGLAVVVHPTYLLAAVLLGLWVLGRDRLRGGLLIGALALALVPTTTKNFSDFGRLALVSHNAGINFYLGNNPAWRTTAFLRPGLSFRKLALEAEPARRNVAERNDYWRQRAISEIRAHPDAWGAALLTKGFWSIHNTEVPRNEDYRCRLASGPLSWMRWLPVRYGLVFPFALLGSIGLAVRRSWRIVPVSWLALQLPMVLFLVADRYRLATWPLLCLSAPIGVQIIGAVIHRRLRPRWLLPLTAGVIPWLPTDPVIDVDPAWCIHVQGNFAYMDKQYEEAMSLYQAAVAQDPGNLSAWTYIAALHERRRNYQDAIDAMEHVLSDFPDHFPSLRTMSDLYRKSGDISTAADYMGRAYAVPGERTSSGIRYVKLLVEAGRIEEAKAVVAADPELQGHRKLRGVFTDRSAE